MKLPRNDPRVRSAVRGVELLENRLLLSATLVTQIPTQNLAAGQTSAAITLSTFLNDPAITGGTVIEMQTPLGNIPLELTNSQTPLTVANFLQYITNGEYTPTIIQRSAPGFVLQGGGTKPDGSNNASVANLQGEPGISNTTGTIAMALSNGPNSGTNQWFINLADNSSLLDGSSDGGPFTVFGNVIDGGMTVANAIAQLPIIDGSAENQNWFIGPNDGLPVINYTGSSTPNTVPASNLVTDNIVVIPAAQAAPTYTAVSANPGLVTASVSNGALTLTPASNTASGSTTVTATITDLGGETATSTFTVNVGSVATGASATTLAAASPAVAVGGSDSLVAQVNPVVPGPTPTGSVTFDVGGASIGTATLAGGTATLNAKFSTAGDEVVTAVYGGDSNYAGSTSSGVTVDVAAPSLTPVAGKSTLPSAVVGGAPVHGNATVVLTNSTQTLEKGTATVNLFASLDGAIDSSAVRITTLKHAVNLKAGKSVAVSVATKDLPATLADGKYTLLFQTIDPAGNVTDAISGPTIQVAAPFVSLSASGANITPPAIKLGKSGTFTMTLANDGNIASSGSASINIGLSADDQTEAVTLLDTTKAEKVEANGKLVLRLHFVAPLSATAGTYHPFVSITEDGSTATALGTTPITLESA